MDNFIQILYGIMCWILICIIVFTSIEKNTWQEFIKLCHISNWIYSKKTRRCYINNKTYFYYSDLEEYVYTR